MIDLNPGISSIGFMLTNGFEGAMIISSAFKSAIFASFVIFADLIPLYFSFMIFGLVLSVILTGAMATYLANYIQKHLWIAYVGLGFILIVAIQLVIGGLADLDILSINEEFRKYF